MSKPLRVLQVVTVMDQGGAETMLMNHYRVIDRVRVQFDFLVCRKERGFYDGEIESMGGRIFRSMPIRPWNYRSFFRWIDSFFAEYAQEFIAVHSHIQENSGFVFKYAQKHGIRNCIAHSHIAFRGIDLKIPFRRFAHYFQLKYSTYNLSCGIEAGKYLFGNRHYELFYNAIDAKKFAYNENTRQRIRAELGISSRFVIGSVARITWQKNHTFMIDVLEKLVKSCPEALLLLVGTGDKEREIRQKIESKNLVENVMLLGNRSNINEILQAFDIFFMPSLFEGLPVSVIEAQAAGLPCILSDTIDTTTDVTGLVRFVSLNAGLDVWCDQIIKIKGSPRVQTYQQIVGTGYDVHKNVRRMMELYGIESTNTSDVDKESPLVTIGLPVWNGEKTVADSIRSVLCQTYDNYELIITDDCSDDGTLQIIRSFDDPRIRIVEGAENCGIAQRLNDQIKMARGLFFARMDADDLMMPLRIEKQVKVMLRHPEIDVLGTSIIVIDEKHQVLGKRLSGKKQSEICDPDYLLHPTVMGRTEWFRKNPYNPDYSGWEDYDLWLRTKRYTTMKSLSEPLLFYKDSKHIDVKKFLRRRIIGCKVIMNEWMYFDNPLRCFVISANIISSCILVPIIHLLHLDEIIIKRRNIPLSEQEVLNYESSLKVFPKMSNK